MCRGPEPRALSAARAHRVSPAVPSPGWLSSATESHTRDADGAPSAHPMSRRAPESPRAYDGVDIAIVWTLLPVFGDCTCLLYTSPSPRDGLLSRMPSSA